MKKKVKLTYEGIAEEAEKKEKVESNLKKSSTDIKAMFSQRVLAFLIDLVLLSMITSIMTMFIPVNDTASKLYEEQDSVLEDYVNGTISMEDYVNQLVDLGYDISRQTVIISIVAVVISLLYYVVYPCYNKGQTFGKKLMKIRIKKVNDKELSMNDLLIRSMINNSILVNIINITLVLFVTKDLYLGSTSLINGIQYIVLITSLIMIAFTKKAQGLHDKAAKTEVVMADTVKEDVLCQVGN